LNNKLETYWKKVGGNSLSDEFKDLILKMFSYDGNKRPTIAELKAHPWINKPYSVKLTRSFIMDRLNEKRSEKTTHASSKDEDKSYRGGDMKELVRQASES
jgi:serine/threonine protein kinase